MLGTSTVGEVGVSIPSEKIEVQSTNHRVGSKLGAPGKKKGEAPPSSWPGLAQLVGPGTHLPRGPALDGVAHLQSPCPVEPGRGVRAHSVLFHSVLFAFPG